MAVVVSREPGVVVVVVAANMEVVDVDVVAASVEVVVSREPGVVVVVVAANMEVVGSDVDVVVAASVEVAVPQ